MPAWDRSIKLGGLAVAPLVFLATALPPAPGAAAPSGSGRGVWLAAASDPYTVATTSILLSLGTAALLLAFGLISARRRTARTLDDKQTQLTMLQADLDRSEALLEAQNQLSVLYGPDGAAVYGDLPRCDEMPKEASAIADYDLWLDTASARKLRSLLEGLRAGGEAFSSLVKTRGGTRIEVQGRTAGGQAVLILRALSAERLEQVHLQERIAGLELETGSLRNLIDSLPDAAWIRDGKGRLTWVNSAYAEALGVAKPEFVIEGQLELLDKKDSAAISSDLKGGPRQRREISNSEAGGEARLDVRAVRLGKGEAAIARDVSESERLRDEMSRLLEGHARTLDQIGTAVSIFGRDGKLRFANAAYRQLWQLDDVWLDSGPTNGEIFDRLRTAGRRPEQADYRTWKSRQLKNLAAPGTAEELWHLPDGQTLRLVAQPHPQGGVTCLYENVTETLALQSRHTAMMNVQRETLDNLAEGVALFSSDGRLRLYNAAFSSMWRLPNTDLDAEPRIDQVIASSRALCDDGAAWTRLKGCITAMGDARRSDNLRFERADQSVIDCLIVPLPGGDTLVTYVDVTDTALAERALRERNEALEAASSIKSAFIRHVSYVLRAPLTTITGYSDLLSREATGPLNDKQREYAGHVLASSHSLLAIINDILDLATIDAGTMEMEIAPVQMTEVMHTAAQGLDDRIRQARLTLDLDEPGDIGTFLADGKRITQVLFNLLANAITYSQPGGRIAVSCTRKDDDVLIEVSDQGRGISPEKQALVFERFESEAPGSGQRGAGLGLSLVKSLVELHGGEVRLHSTPGEGTTITCVFPISPEAAGRRKRYRLVAGGQANSEAPREGKARPAAG
jgi:signal transduction histidine kinase